MQPVEKKPWPVKFVLPEHHYSPLLKKALDQKTYLAPKTAPRNALLAVVFDEMLKYTKCECFPENKGLKPKFHFLIHYPTLIKKFGPLIYLWTLRFEAKHSYFKGLINQIKCWKNITYTLAKRHQYLQCYHNTARHNFLQSEKMNETGGKPKDFNKLGKDLQRELRPLLHDQPNVHSASSICLNGINYCKGLFVVLKVDGHIITFGKIMKIYIISGVSWLWCSVCELRGYDRHKHSYKVYVCTEAQNNYIHPQIYLVIIHCQGIKLMEQLILLLNID